jgi:cobalt-zinc-cadmium efflux system outer membrane protein
MLDFKFTSKKPIHNRFFGSISSNYIFSAISIFLLTSNLNAMEPSSSTLTIKEAVVKSLKQHPGLASFAYRVQSSDHNIVQAAIGKKPEVSLVIEDAMGTGDYSDFSNAQSTLSISWILDGGLVNNRVQQYKHKKALTEIELEIKRYDVAAETAHQFITILALQDRLKIAKEAHLHSRKILKEITHRVNSGKALMADQLRAEVNLERRELEVEDIAHELISAKKILSSSWGQSSIGFSSASGSLNLPKSLIDYSELEQAISSNPKVRYFLTQQRLTEGEISLAREEGKNRLRFNAGVSHNGRTEDYGLTMGITLPFGGNNNQGKISSLNADKNRYQAELIATETQLLTQVFVLHQELMHSYHVSNSLTYEIIPRLEKALKETYKAYQLGKYSYQEWSSVQQEVYDAQFSLIDARFTAHKNTVELERLTGLAMQSYKKRTVN